MNTTHPAAPACTAPKESARPRRLATRALAVLTAALLSACGTTGNNTQVAGEKLFDAGKPLQIADQGVFYIPGQYVDEGNSTIMIGQMFVQYQVPAKRTRPYPIVLMHGGGQTGSNFLGTPDGRRGWADYFVAQGYAVYVVDQAGRGRSGYYTKAYGPTRRPSTGAMSQRFTASAKSGASWAQAQFHTQWPGSGVKGDPVFDEFFASQVEDMEDLTKLEKLNADAGVKLLEKIGPAVVLTHSQAGPIGWQMANARPDLIKALIAVEPNGPPVYEAGAATAAGTPKDAPISRAWGITRNALAYDPPAATAKDLRFAEQAQADGPNLLKCQLQAEPARKLVKMQGFPMVIVMSESSYHTPYDHCTSKYLTQAGVRHELVHLADKGIKGNGHMIFLEKNNLEVARFLESWERASVR